MRRRDFIATVASACAWPQALRAQILSRQPLIAYLSAVTPERTISTTGAFLQGLRELDYVEGRDYKIVYRSAEGYMDRLPGLAEELVQLHPSVVLAVTTPAAVVTRALTQTIPIVCPLLADPIRFGLIASVARPGGNVTGILFRTEGLVSKQLELARQLLPGIARIGLLVNVATATVIDRQEAESTSERLAIRLIPAEVRTPADIDTAFQVLAKEHAQAVVVLVDGMLFNERQRIAALAAAERLPAVYGFRDHVDAGGLISYGVNLAENFHRAATYVQKIFKGAKPGDLPVEFPTKLELVVNLKTAQALGLTIPSSVFARADEVIE